MHEQIRRMAAVAAVTILAAAPALAQQGETVGTILIAHGAGPDWNAQVETIASLANTGGPVEVSYLMGDGAHATRFQDVAQRLVERGASQIVVVPMLVSSHSGHYEQIRFLTGETDEIAENMLHHLHMAGIEPADVDVPIRLTRAIDDSPDVASVLAERALELAEDPAQQALYLVGHGPNSAEDNAAWMANLRTIAASVQEQTGFRDVKIGLVRDDAPAAVRAEAVQGVREVIQLQHGLTARPVVVVPVLISTGSVSQEKLPQDLAGLPIVYSGDALLPHPELARWVEARVREGSR